MQQVLLYDRTRVPPNWMELIRPGQYAAFLSDVESSAPLTSDGTPVDSAAEYSCLLCDSLAEAEGYCREVVHKTRRLKCEVFDSAGRANAPVATLVNEEFAHTLDTETRARQLIRWGLISFAISLPLFWYAWRSGAEVVWWPVLIGIQLVFAGLRLIHWGHGLKDELRYRKDDAARRQQQNVAKQAGK